MHLRHDKVTYAKFLLNILNRNNLLPLILHVIYIQKYAKREVFRTELNIVLLPENPSSAKAQSGKSMHNNWFLCTSRSMCVGYLCMRSLHIH